MDSSAAQTTQSPTGVTPTPPAASSSTASVPGQQSAQSMSPQKPVGSTNKGLILSIIIVVVVVVGVGVYAFMSKQSPNSADSMNSLTTQVSHTPQLSVAPSNAMKMNQSQGNGLTSGTTNTDLTQDSTTLNKQLDSVNSEMNNADQGLNDQPANLTQ